MREERIRNESRYRDEMTQELLEAVSTCGPRLYRIEKDHGTAYIYHNDYLVIQVLPEDVLWENNYDLSNALEKFLRELRNEHALEFVMATWQEYNKQPADVFLNWMAENHPEYEFKSEYIGPEMKDTRTKFGVYYENGQKVYYN